MLKVVLPSLLLLSSLALFAEEAPKQEPPKVDPVLQHAGYNFVGINLGISRPVGENSSGIPLRFQYEVEGIHALGKQFAVGAFASRNSGPIAKNSSIDINFSRLGAEAIFSPTYDTFVDLRSGVGFVSADAKVSGKIVATSDTFHPLFLGLGGGLNIPVVEKITFVPALHYTRFFGTSDTSEFDMFDVTAGVRMSF